MTEPPLHERRFTDREVREILKKAVEEAPSGAVVRREGLSLAELQAVGREVGIDPDRLEEAARAVAHARGRRRGHLLGGPRVLSVERRVDGELATEDPHEAVALIRRTMGRPGDVSEVRGAVEWSSKGETGERHVTLWSRDGTTTIQGAADLTNAAVLTYLPAGAGGVLAAFVGLGTFLNDGSLVGLIVALAILPVLYPILRTVFGRVTDAESARLQRAVDGLARLAEEKGEGAKARPEGEDGGSSPPG